MDMDINKVKSEAQKEFTEEQETAAKKLVKEKMKELSAAKQIVKNLERELEDLYDKLQQRVG
jgi:hypothetical protein